jgi:hypothetical protein
LRGPEAETAFSRRYVGTGRHTPDPSTRSARTELSFFEGDEPTRVSRPARPRRPTGGRSASGGGGGARPPDRQTLLVRQAVAIGLGLLLLILLVVGVRSCQNSRQENALKDYNRAVTAVIKSSDNDVMRPFFGLMSNGAQEGQDLQVQVNQLRQAADDDAQRAGGFDVPDEMADAQHDLLMVLNFRRQGLARIADAIPAAQGRGVPAEQAVGRIAANMQLFLASDVVYSQRVAPYIKQALDDAGVAGQTIATSRSLPSVEWLSPQYVAERLGSEAAGGTSGGGATAGLHGHGLTSVGANNVTLQPGGVINRVPVTGGVTFKVSFQNQGDNNERNVRVTVTVRGGPKPITAQKIVPQTTAKQPAEVSIPLGATPPTGQATTVEVVVNKVPGEKNTENNRQTYTVLFTQ